ncbi:hypothetical protein V3390_01215 [Luteimonas sp. FXH3W]|uniref:ATP synthase protein I n=1 Tax=Aquilutibacter rugosus TaxID=3115820 RepID=A0ABU7UWF8_9GAMM
MYNPLSAGRRHARHAAGFGLVATVLTALVFFALQHRWEPALAALTGGLGVVAGSWLGARVALGGRAQAAGLAFMRLLVGLGVKWLLVVAAMVFSVARGWPPLPLLIAVIVAILAPLAAELINLRNKV